MQSLFGPLFSSRKATDDGCNAYKAPETVEATREAVGASCSTNATLDAAEVRRLVRLNESLQRQINELSAEDVVHSEVAVQLAEKVVVLRRQLQRREEEMHAMNSFTFTTDVSGSLVEGSPSAARCNSSVSPVKSETNGTLYATEEAAAVRQGRDSSLGALRDAEPSLPHGSNTELQSKLAEMEAQMAVWKRRVKSALRTSQERERSLLSENITLQQTTQELQEKLNEATFHIEATALRNARQSTKVSRACQVDATSDGMNSGNDSFGEENNLELTGSCSTRQQRRHHHRPTRMPSYVLASSSGLTAASAAGFSADQQQELVTENGDGGGGSASRSSPLNFPYPQLLPVSGSGGAPMPISSSDPASHSEASPFIVAVHYSNADGWSVETKLRVLPGMTVAQLKERCCSRFHERHLMVLDPATLCVRFHHEKSGRQVVLSAYRELHSFAHFQRCEREKTPIVLYLAPEDNLSRLVHDMMNVANVAQTTPPRQQSE
ncbi:hypothetical protein DQ04_00301050 [Trypanosoma grayi]|uniref:hypothetical protein n=1 Tax=Trypanosoma grayi TaxID=71804 RepID=UPI0004F41479|nr:hypothetical protein DQ04_00301050 [Trypanosoma grayi]KEG14795.1 hypothetical protein DQ04_00301050 [Trypanosoma grayi]